MRRCSQCGWTERQEGFDRCAPGCPFPITEDPPSCIHGFSGNGAMVFTAPHHWCKVAFAAMSKRAEDAEAVLNLNGWEFYEDCWVQKTTGVLAVVEPPRTDCDHEYLRAEGSMQSLVCRYCNEFADYAEPQPPVYTPLEELLREENEALRNALRYSLKRCPHCNGNCLSMYDSAGDGYAEECEICPRGIVLLARGQS